jgi:hypothetical protein
MTQLLPVGKSLLHDSCDDTNGKMIQGCPMESTITSGLLGLVNCQNIVNCETHIILVSIGNIPVGKQDNKILLIVPVLQGFVESYNFIRFSQQTILVFVVLDRMRELDRLLINNDLLATLQKLVVADN